MRTIKKSLALQARANQVIAGGALTNSKRPQSFVRGVYPTHLESGLRAMVKDVDGNQYVDYICGLGSILFGHRNQKIESAVIAQSLKGTVFSLGTELEVEVAELFCNKFSHIQKLTFLKTSSEACSAAVRIARSFTGRLHVLSDGYHGWHDEFTYLTPPAHGVPPQDFIAKIGQFPDYPPAAVIVEPVITDWSDERIEYLRKLREQTHKDGALLIFDETITGLRFPELSVARYTGIKPDLTIMGKSIAGGYPLSLVGGRRDVMDSDYFVSSTFAGDCIALAAAKAVIGIINEPQVMERMCTKAQAFCKALNSIAPELITIEGYGTRGILKGTDIHKALFMQESVKAGVLFGPSFLYGTTHEEHDEHVLSICHTVLNRIKNGQVSLEGEMPVKPFAQRVREA